MHEDVCMVYTRKSNCTFLSLNTQSSVLTGVLASLSSATADHIISALRDIEEVCRSSTVGGINIPQLVSTEGGDVIVPLKK